MPKKNKTVKQIKAESKNKQTTKNKKEKQKRNKRLPEKKNLPVHTYQQISLRSARPSDRNSTFVRKSYRKMSKR